MARELCCKYKTGSKKNMQRLELYTERDLLMTITQEQALRIELKLNLSPEGKLWRELGDTLYEFHTRQTPTRLCVTPAQFNFIHANT